MPLTFHPGPGAIIIICDFETGFRPSEMVKIRPVVVISPRRRTTGLVTVVPLSSTASNPPEPWHYRLATGLYPPARGPMWVKGDMVATVALSRLDRVKVKDSRGKRTYRMFQVRPGDLTAILTCVLAALGLP